MILTTLKGAWKNAFVGGVFDNFAALIGAHGSLMCTSLDVTEIR